MKKHIKTFTTILVLMTFIGFGMSLAYRMIFTAEAKLNQLSRGANALLIDQKQIIEYNQELLAKMTENSKTLDEIRVQLEAIENERKLMLDIKEGQCTSPYGCH